MQSNDARTLLQTAVPTAAVGVIAVVAGGVLGGEKAAIGAGVGTLVVIAAMGVGLAVLLRTARALPQLFQMMGLALYTAQILLLFIFMAVFKDTTMFNPRAFAIALIAATLTWVASMIRAHMKAKILYVQPDSADDRTSEPTGSAA
ncbi:hypothetical protein [Streptomyces sp. NPDC048639]|uniref:hypothetical protein n=1 Tax=Streptomyces sp. NPDC048639 TaxID=3365581 RepID=UPI00371C7C41